MHIQTFLGHLIRPFRKRRMMKFIETFRPRADQTILDVGGSAYNWDLVNFQGSVVMLNLDPVIGEQARANMKFVVGDGTALAYEDDAFDIVFSNSVIEHVGGYENQRQMANEIRRVGRRFFVQTPNKRFPLEPHFLFPWFQYLPLATRAWLVNRFDVGWYKRIPDAVAARAEVESIQLLTKGRLSALFPGARVHEEKLAGLTKSFVAIDGW